MRPSAAPRQVGAFRAYVLLGAISRGVGVISRGVGACLQLLTRAGPASARAPRSRCGQSIAFHRRYEPTHNCVAVQQPAWTTPRLHTSLFSSVFYLRNDNPRSGTGDGDETMCVYSLYTIPARTQPKYTTDTCSSSSCGCTLASRMQTEGALCTVRLRLM